MKSLFFTLKWNWNIVYHFSWSPYFDPGQLNWFDEIGQNKMPSGDQLDTNELMHNEQAPVLREIFKMARVCTCKKNEADVGLHNSWDKAINPSEMWIMEFEDIYQDDANRNECTFTGNSILLSLLFQSHRIQTYKRTTKKPCYNIYQFLYKGTCLNWDVISFP